MKTKELLSLLITLIFVASCVASNEKGALVPTVTSAKIPIQIIPISEERKVVDDIRVSQNNCNGSAPVKQTFEKSYSIQYSLMAEAGLTVDADGNIGIPGVGQVGIGASVASKYGVKYGKSEQLKRSIDYSAKEGTSVTHTMHLLEIWETGNFVVGNNTYQYKFLKDFDLEYGDAQQNLCPVQAQSPNPTPALSNPIAKCSLKQGQIVVLGPNTNLWDTPNSTKQGNDRKIPMINGSSAVILGENALGVVNLSYPDIIDYWWKVKTSQGEGWIWQGRIQGCP